MNNSITTKHRKSLSDSEIKNTVHENEFEILGIEDDDVCDAICNAEEMSVDDIKEVTRQQKNTAYQTKDCKEWEEAHGDLLGKCKGLENCMVERDDEVDEIKFELYYNKMINCIDINEKREQMKENIQCAKDYNQSADVNNQITDDCNRVVNAHNQLCKNYIEVSDLCAELSIKCNKVKSIREQREDRKNRSRCRS